MLRVRPRLAATVVLATCVTGCTGGGAPVPATPSPMASSAATPSGSGTAPSSSVTPTAPAPTPSPSAPTLEVGIGEVRLQADDDSFLSSEVRGDCLVAGDSLPPDDTGSALGDDVEFFVAVDNYLGAFGEPVAPRPIVITVDGSDGVATIELFGWPQSFPWWSGQVETATLSAPLVQDGVTTATLEVAATLDRADPPTLQVPKPRPPRPARPAASPAPSGPSPAGDATSTPAGAPASPRTSARQPDSWAVAGLVRGEASPTPTPTLTPAEPTPAEPTPAPATPAPATPTPATPPTPSAPTPPAPTPTAPATPDSTPTPPAATPSPAPTQAPVQSVELTLTLSCTTLH